MPYPSSERLIGCVALCPSLKCEVIGVCWLSVYPSCVRWFLCWLCLASSERLYSVERGVVYSRLYLPQILSGGSLCGSPVWTNGLEILLCEGGDVKLCARTSKHISVFAFDPLSLTLSLTLCIASYCHIIYMLVLFVCAHTCVNQKSFT